MSKYRKIIALFSVILYVTFVFCEDFNTALQKAEQGDAVYQYKVGYAYRWGQWGQVQNLDAAVKWWTKAANQNNADAQEALGILYEHGWGVKKDLNEAERYYTAAAKQHHARALWDLGQLYSKDRNNPQKMEYAFKLFMLSAKVDVTCAGFSVGLCYEYGSGVEKNYSEALRWYRLYADEVDRQAIENTKKYGLDYPMADRSSYQELKSLGISEASTPIVYPDWPWDEDIPLTMQEGATSQKQMPLLVLVNESLSFNELSGNNIIDAEEKSTIKFNVKNSGKGPAVNCEARVKLSGSTSGIKVKTIKLPTIAVGQTHEVNIPITADINTQNGKVTFSVEVYEPNGWGVAPFDLTVATKAYEAPYLQVVDYNITSNSGKIKKMEPFSMTFNLQNTKYGVAEDVKVKINLPENIYIVEGEKELTYPQILSGEVKNVQLSLIANNNYATTNIPVTIDVKERYGKYAENRKLDIALNQATSSTIQIEAKDEPQQERKEIQLAMLKSEVDRNIPVAKAKNPNTFVLIIANEHYSQVATVPFALNDGNIFREYCIKTLGIGEKHIKYLSDATGNQIKAGVNWLANLTEAFDNPQIIVYYAGHGIPDETNKSAYLLPVDGSGTDVTTGYKLDDLYTTLGNMPASRITVFMDACFSGSKREEGMLASARGVALKAKSGVPQGNMVVFSAAQGDETAYPNREQQHGLFTYYLLKKLQETEGNVALKELGDYVTKQVTQQSLLLNSKKQTPSVTPSVSLGTEWQTWKLK